MALLDTIAHRGTAKQHRPWPRAIVTDDGWRQAIDQLTAGKCTLLGLWADAGDVHMALLGETFDDIAVLSYACKDGRYPSVATRHPPAIRLERAIRDLFGLEATDAPDTRSWLDLGFWDVRYPLGKKEPRAKACDPTPFCRRKAKACIRFRSGPCMPVSSSQAISASPPMASMSCGSSNGSVMCTRASNR